MEGPTLYVVGVLVVAAVSIIGFFARAGLKWINTLIDKHALEVEIMKFSSSQTILQGFKNELRDAVIETVDALDQEYVRDWKKASEDGKLTADEISQLNAALITRVKKNFSKNGIEFLVGAVGQIDDLILEMAKGYLDTKREMEAKKSEAA